ncbi:hypothetical protein PG994_014500 [Apiospora phragmitis]|uniref:Uncharacterized protein n=1 Tax=Apiospora phragmitis TaxID=2905665 RepID=A0ABR1T6W7_9PEZI
MRIQILLHLFEFGSVRGPDDLDYPSWVPDWSKPRKRELAYRACLQEVDGMEEYPACLDVSDKAILTMEDDILQVQPCPSVSGDQTWQVMYASPPSVDYRGSPQFIEMLNRLFPAVWALYYKTSASWTLDQEPPRLPALAERLALVLKRQHSTMSQYLFGEKEDKDNPEFADITVTTMLVLRYHEDLPRQQSGYSNQAYQVGKQKGIIVGPAVCVELGGKTTTYQSHEDAG